MRIALGVEYEGDGFCGWQTQPSRCGVQDALDAALSAVAAEAVEWSAGQRRLYGVGADGAPPTYEGWLELVHPEDREEYLKNFEKASRQRAQFEGEVRFRRYDGEYRWMRTVARPRLGPNREYLGYAGLTIDMTERRLAELPAIEFVRANPKTGSVVIEYAPELGGSLDVLATIGEALGVAISDETRSVATDTPDYISSEEAARRIRGVLRNALLQQLQAMQQAGYTLMVVEQNAAKVLSVADRGYVLELGRNRFEGTGRALLSDPDVKRLYLGG